MVDNVEVGDIFASYYNFFETKKMPKTHPKKYKYKTGKYLNSVKQSFEMAVAELNIGDIKADKIRLHLFAILLHRKSNIKFSLYKEVDRIKNDLIELEEWKTFFDDEVNVIMNHSSYLTVELLYKLYNNDTIKWYTFLFIYGFIFKVETEDFLKKNSDVSTKHIIHLQTNRLSRLFFLTENIFKPDRSYILKKINTLKDAMGLTEIQ